ncbi:MAG: protease complex subunit PrcB family protein [Bacteroidota bacterium]
MQRISFILILALGLASVLPACKSSKTPTEGGSENADSAMKVSWEVLDEGPYCGIEESVSQLITNSDDWQTFYKKFGSNRMPAPEAPEVNFEENYLIVALMGMRTSGGHKVEINSMMQSGETVKVGLTYVAPGDKCMVTEALTQPYIFALISNKNVSAAEFEVVERTDDCNQ